VIRSVPTRMLESDRCAPDLLEVMRSALDVMLCVLQFCWTLCSMCWTLPYTCWTCGVRPWRRALCVELLETMRYVLYVLEIVLYIL